MQLAYSLPWWLGLLVAAVVVVLALAPYRRPLRPLQVVPRIVLVGCRLLSLSALVLFVLRPSVLVVRPPERNSVVPVLVDVSRSMRVNDADGHTRIGRAKLILQNDLLPALSPRFTPELFGVGERLEPMSLDGLGAVAGRSDLSGALAAVRDRYRGRLVPGIILLSDGVDTGQSSEVPTSASDPPVFAVGLGSPDAGRDREITGLTAGEQQLDQATVDFRVSAISSGYGRAPFVIRILANGRSIDSRRVVPAAEGAPVEEVFTLSPDPANPTVYTAEIPAEAEEPITENNSRSILVNPTGRKRRILIFEGAPGFEQAFIKRAWLRDSGLEVDAVGRKGKDAEGRGTFYVQADATRGAALTTGLPRRREELFEYDALVIANAESDLLTQAQLAMAAEFVGERGGGLLMIGSRSLTPRGLAGTPLEGVIPVELDDRQGRLSVESIPGSRTDLSNKVVVTPEGENHPVVRIGKTPDETRQLWAALPALVTTTPLGGARPGATVLAVTASSTGAVYPVIAVQRYGRGRSMIFGGEASWRWRMLMPSTNLSYERFWRQSARWLSGSAPDAVTISVPQNADVGDNPSMAIEVRDAAFAPVSDASVEASISVPGVATARSLSVRRANGASGQYTTGVAADRSGLFRVDVSARRGATMLGSVTRWFYVGGSDREFADPRLNEPWLSRLARATGGRYVRSAQASQVAGWLQESSSTRVALERRDLWHSPWAFALLIALLSTEWILRRRWGLR
jgi:uncharacterized membrane protein